MTGTQAGIMRGVTVTQEKTGTVMKDWIMKMEKREGWQITVFPGESPVRIRPLMRPDFFEKRQEIS
ncbi:hypothetical protein B9H02_03935 [Prosthecochloris sp. HL-130-GSB]|jgi:hypothetical protein|nr:hypothetical protein B9H02_03935 [Prosthecochloris sp. HL-130-GSB]